VTEWLILDASMDEHGAQPAVILSPRNTTNPDHQSYLLKVNRINYNLKSSHGFAIIYNALILRFVDHAVEIDFNFPEKQAPDSASSKDNTMLS